MRGKLSVVGLFLIAAVGYIAWPFYTAWSIRDAVKTGKPDVLAATVHFPTVKATLKESLRHMAAPGARVVRADGLPSYGKTAKVGWWTRIKNAVKLGVVNRMVERYGTPEGFGRMFSYGKFYRARIKGLEDPEAGLSLWGKATRVWARVRRAEFKSWTRFELDMVDKFDANRMYAGVLTLTASGWKLTELRVFDRTLRHVATAGALSR